MAEPLGLNASQRAAVLTTSGPLLVLAGAGTGKTRVITHRIAELIRRGTNPTRILAVTFTNKAAREMRERALGLLGKRVRKKAPEISTFHSLCVRILRRHCRTLGYPASFTIYDRGDQETVARSALRDIRVAEQKLRPGELLGFIGAWKTQSIRPDEAHRIADGERAEIAAAAYERYQAAIRAAGAVDFDDLLLLTEELFDRFADARFAEASRFDHLLIDEYQDTNALQYRIVKALADRHRNLCVVGDDDQSIYAWRGADVAHILAFQHDWPDAKVVRLEDNYRSRAPILELANRLILHNSTRHPKALRPSREGGTRPRFFRFEDESAEAEGVVREIKNRIDPTTPDRVSASDIAILFRTNEQPRAFELELRRQRIRYVLVGGLSFYDRREVKDLVGYLRVLANPLDEVSLLRIINVPARGIGTGTIQTLLEDAVRQGVPLGRVLETARSDARLGDAAVERIEAFRSMIDGYRVRVGHDKLAELLSDLVRTIRYRDELERLYGKTPGEVEARWEAVQELINAAALYEQRATQPSLLGFLEEVALADRDDQKDDDARKPHALTLMTLHSAKGLEFPHVYLVGMEEGLLPHQRSVESGGRGIEEERRLCYVGVTRAMDSLAFSFCKARMKWGTLRPAIPSRFLMEMRGETERARRAAEAAEQRFGRSQPPDAASTTGEPGTRNRAPEATVSKKRATRSERRARTR